MPTKAKPEPRLIKRVVTEEYLEQPEEVDDLESEEDEDEEDDDDQDEFSGSRRRPAKR